jgi:hypothetical protein
MAQRLGFFVRLGRLGPWQLFHFGGLRKKSINGYLLRNRWVEQVRLEIPGKSKKVWYFCHIYYIALYASI